jgi:DNA-binding beta-propeller fold protein YncE
MFKGVGTPAARACLIAAASWMLAAGSSQARTAPADVITQLSLPGDEGWDYLTYEQHGQRLFIAHGTRVLVVDARTLTLAGEVSDTPGVHGIALAPELGRGYVSAGKANLIVVFDLKTLARLKEISTTGENPDAILYDPATQRVFTFNGRGRNATAVDARTDQVVGSIALDAKPEFAASDGAGHVYVNLEDKNSIAVIDPRALRVTAVWHIPGCEEPTGLALEKSEHWLTTVCGNRVLAVIDSRTGHLLGTAPIGSGVDATAVDHRMAIASCGEGVLTLLKLSERGVPVVAQTISTQPGARTAALDAANQRVFLVTADFGAAPAATAQQPHARPPLVPGSFRLLVVQLPTAARSDR